MDVDEYRDEKIWYVGEIECGGDGTDIIPKGFGIKLGRNFSPDFGWVVSLRQGLFDLSHYPVIEQADGGAINYDSTGTAEITYR